MLRKATTIARVTAVCLALLTTAVPAFAFNTDELVPEQDAASADEYPLSAREEDELSRFREPAPSLTSPLATFAVQLDPQGLIPKPLLEKAVAYYQENAALLGNRSFLGIINFSARSTEKRFFIVDMTSGAVRAFHVAHGKGSDGGDGRASRFGNVVDSHMSSLGFYRTASTYDGKHGRSLRLDGLSDTNSNARRRAIVIHGADYVHEADVVQGRSFGCPAVAMSVRDQVVNSLKDGAIIFAGL